MKIYSRIIVLAILFLMSNMTQAQEDEYTEVKGKHAIGLSLGTTTSSGFTYKYYGERIRLKGNVWGYGSKDGTIGAVGLTGYFLLDKKISKEGRIDFFLYQSNSVRFEPRSDRGYGKSGFGAGVEKYTHNEALSFELMGGAGVYDDYSTFAPTFEVAMYYRF